MDKHLSPITVEGNNLYVSSEEWEHLIKSEFTEPIKTVLRDARTLLGKGGSVRLLGTVGEVMLSADRPDEMQSLIDDANTRRAAMGLAPVVLID